MGIHPIVRKYLQTSPPNPYDNVVRDYAKIREWMDSMMTKKKALTLIYKVENLIIRGQNNDIPIRIYTPNGGKKLPLLIFFHGGGFVLGSIDGYDLTCRKLALESGHKVISVGYRLAPENPFPAAPEDCFTITKWAAEHTDELEVDASRISISGTSAGGNLAATVAIMSRDSNGPKLSKQVLIYPVMDYHEHGRESHYPSYKVYGQGYNLTSKAMGGFWSLYLGENLEYCNQPYACPIKVEDGEGLPPALIITAEFDPVRDEGEKYGELLQSSNIPVQIIRYDGMIHGFLKFSDSKPTQDVYSRICYFLCENV